MANLKFSQFTEQTDTANVQFIVGYNGATNVRISPDNINGAYLPLAGGTITGPVIFSDNSQLQLGTNNDMRIYHDPSGSGTNIFNSTLGNLKFIQGQDNGLIEFENDNGAGNTESYFILNGSDETIRAYKTLKSGTTNLALEANNAGFVEIRSANGTTPGTLQLNCEQNSHGIKIQGPPHSAGANYTLVFPTTDGGTGEFLQTNGSGVLTWAAAGTGTVTSVTTGDANTITIGGTAAAPTIAANTAAVTNASLNLATGDQIYDFVIAQNYTSNTGTVTSVATTHAGNAFTATIGNVSTVNPSVDITLNGSSSQYIDGAGNLTTFPTIPTVPANIVETVTTTDGAFIDLTPNVATDGAVTVTADLSATGTPNSSSYLRGDNTWATIPGGFTSFDITGGSGSAQTITDGNTITLAQGTGISTVAAATDTVTITNTLPFNNLSFQGDSGALQQLTNAQSLTLTGGTGLSSVMSVNQVTFNANVDGTQSVAANTSTTTAARTYKVQVDSSDNLVVNVPWTSGSGGIGGSISNTQVAFGNSSGEITGDVDFNFNVSTNTLRVGVDNDYTGGIVAMAMTADSMTTLDMTLAQYIYHQSDTNTRFGFPANDTFTIDTNSSERMRIASTGAVQLNTYGSGTFTGTAAYALSVDSSGNIIETTAGGAAYPFSTDGVNSLYSGFVPTGTLTGTENTILGIDAGASTSSNDDNTLIGYKAGFSGAIGFTGNTVVGSEAFDAATTCTYNTVLGHLAGSSATTVVNNAVFIGYNAGFTAINNTGPVAIGSGCMQNASGTFSVGVGMNSFRTATYLFATAIGANAAYSGGGNYGVHLGYEAGRNVTGQNNTCIGRRAGYQGTPITTGSQNTLVGSTVSTSSASLQNATAIGYNAADNGNNTVTLGNTFITGLHCQVQTISSLSDSRDKTNIQKSSYGLDVIEKLNPVTFEWDQRDGGRKGLKDLGFIAQELQESDDEYLQLVNSNDPEKLQASYGRLIPVMIKAIQELQEEIKYLKNK